MNKKLLLLVIGTVTLTGCINANNEAKTDYNAENGLTAPRYTEIKMVKAPLSVGITDVRTYKSIAIVDDPKTERSLTMESSQPVSMLFENALLETLSSQGFQIVSEDDAVGHYDVNILEYNVTSDSNNLLQSTVKVVVKANTSDNSSYFKKQFRASGLHQLDYAPTGKDLSEIVNHVSQSVMNEISVDKELNHFLRTNVELVNMESAL
ncbi:YajG family lipoprotein [Vibrio crassostreae]|uniref:YajG family lipoprotein n=1 Tax=Vibrio crassostreae TaxID=246167 RepID=UPI001B300A8F|nr:YajG family lipoprotein [Vibrio crassostreae]